MWKTLKKMRILKKVSTLSLKIYRVMTKVVTEIFPVKKDSKNVFDKTELNLHVDPYSEPQ